MFTEAYLKGLLLEELIFLIGLIVAACRGAILAPREKLTQVTIEHQARWD
jgi:hypothetical protein